MLILILIHRLVLIIIIHRYAMAPCRFKKNPLYLGKYQAGDSFKINVAPSILVSCIAINRRGASFSGPCPMNNKAWQNIAGRKVTELILTPTTNYRPAFTYLDHPSITTYPLDNKTAIPKTPNDLQSSVTFHWSMYMGNYNPIVKTTPVHDMLYVGYSYPPKNMISPPTTAPFTITSISNQGTSSEPHLSYDGYSLTPYGNPSYVSAPSVLLASKNTV